MASMSSVARDTAHDAKDAIKEANKAASAGAREIQDDLSALRDDVARLTLQIGNIVAAKSNQAWRRARSNVEDVLSDAQDKGKEAAEAVRDVGDNMVDAIDESLKRRPYTTLAMAVGIGFLFGATWRR
jgi:ElaB/YqjD/DUF883 family membrane-anchored ribosome-binding protein